MADRKWNELTSRGRAPAVGVSLLLWKPSGVRSLYFLHISGRAYTLPDVPREFYPRCSADSTHFSPNWTPSSLRGEVRKENSTSPRCWSAHMFSSVCFWLDLIPGQLFVTTRRQKQTTIDYKTVCCNSSAPWTSAGISPPPRSFRSN